MRSEVTSRSNWAIDKSPDRARPAQAPAGAPSRPKAVPGAGATARHRNAVRGCQFVGILREQRARAVLFVLRRALFTHSSRHASNVAAGCPCRLIPLGGLAQSLGETQRHGRYCPRTEAAARPMISSVIRNDPTSQPADLVSRR
jgi:hypothetical protein